MVPDLEPTSDSGRMGGEERVSVGSTTHTFLLHSFSTSPDSAVHETAPSGGLWGGGVTASGQSGVLGINGGWGQIAGGMCRWVVVHQRGEKVAGCLAIKEYLIRCTALNPTFLERGPSHCCGCFPSHQQPGHLVSVGGVEGCVVRAQSPGDRGTWW